jgi:endoglucanase
MSIELLEKLSNACGVSGNEGEVREIIENEIRDLVDEIKVDALGNLIAFKKAKNKKPKVMLAAHMDEVGLMVKFIEKTGYLRFAKVGGIDDRVLPAKHVLVGKEKIPGVIGIKPLHLARRDDELKKVIKTDTLYIDIGASSEEEAKKFVKRGDYVTFATRFERTGDVIKGKAFDDRVGCYMLIEVLKETYNFPIYAVFTVQEEVGLRGARVSAHRIEPDFAFALEATPAGDFPEKRDISPAPVLRQGPVITVVDKTMIADRGLVEHLVKIAQEENIQFQFKRPNIGGTDAGRIHLAKAGCRACAIAVACRYSHSPVSFCSILDIENMVKLVKASLKKLGG